MTTKTKTKREQLIAISEVAERLGVSVDAVRDWDEKLQPIITPGGHRRYKLSEIEKLVSGEEKELTETEKDTLRALLARLL